jgi:5-methylcytosine-specific restriction endonuclease McrA
MPTTIPGSLKRVVIQRANYRCEYCGKPAISFYPHEVDHVTAQKHGGATTLDNLAYACFECNRHKGSDLTSIDPETGLITPLFNPRSQNWSEHFRFEQNHLIPLTAEGRVTVFLLQLNTPERIAERVALKLGL